MPAIKIVEAKGEDVQSEVRAPGKRSERDDTQKSLDGLFKTLHTDWLSAHKPQPKEVNGKITYAGPTRRLTVAKADVSALKGMIRRAGTLHGVGVFFYRDHRRDDGQVTVKFGAMTKPSTPPRAAS